MIKITTLTITSRSTTDDELKALLGELLFHQYHETWQVQAAQLQRQLSEESFQHFAFRLTGDEIIQSAKVLRVRDWGEITLTEAKAKWLNDSCATVDDINFDVANLMADLILRSTHIYGCFINSIGKTIALPSNMQRSIRNVACLALAFSVFD